MWVNKTNVASLPIFKYFMCFSHVTKITLDLSIKILQGLLLLKCTILVGMDSSKTFLAGPQTCIPICILGATQYENVSHTNIHKRFNNLTLKKYTVEDVFKLFFFLSRRSN